MMMDVELSELSRFGTVYLRHSSFSAVSEVPLPQPSGRYKVGLNMVFINHPHVRISMKSDASPLFDHATPEQSSSSHYPSSHLRKPEGWTSDQHRAHCSRLQSSPLWSRRFWTSTTGWQTT